MYTTTRRVHNHTSCKQPQCTQHLHDTKRSTPHKTIYTTAHHLHNATSTHLKTIFETPNHLHNATSTQHKTIYTTRNHVQADDSVSHQSLPSRSIQSGFLGRESETATERRTDRRQTIRSIDRAMMQYEIRTINPDFCAEATPKSQDTKLR